MISDLIGRIRLEYDKTFNDLDKWFDLSDTILDFKPDNGGWSIREILEHISLTNHFLLILIRKATAKAISKSKKVDYSEMLANYDLDWIKLNQIGIHESFIWARPIHMEPKGMIDLREVRDKLYLQKYESLSYLDQLKKGEGVLYKTMMTVNDLGKIDVYHYIYFLVQHAKRHITQMEKVKLKMNDKSIT